MTDDLMELLNLSADDIINPLAQVMEQSNLTAPSQSSNLTSLANVSLDHLNQPNVADYFLSPEEGFGAPEHAIGLPLSSPCLPPNSPPLSTVSSGSGGGSVFQFPPPSKTPEAALPLAESLAESPCVDISLFHQPNDLALVEATLKREATGSETAVVKEELAYHIRQRRRASGLQDVILKEDPKPDNNVMTKTDILRRERRKASNRKAATKCRNKKKEADRQMKQRMEELKNEVKQLREEVARLKNDKEKMTTRYNDHLAHCPSRGR